ncbi:hypothetical protein ZWY2020_000703 [Hordeum vulgare]|nr:hypothetical protein ZWY2020_000703 [Hordeum vulgare]
MPDVISRIGSGVQEVINLGAKTILVPGNFPIGRRLAAQISQPGVKIIYADYYGAAMEFVRNPKRNGINDHLVACCGGNGPYGTGHDCDLNAKVCRDPSRFANWDQVHMTEKAYSVIAHGVLNGPYADIPLLHAC